MTYKDSVQPQQSTGPSSGVQLAGIGRSGEILAIPPRRAMKTRHQDGAPGFVAREGRAARFARSHVSKSRAIRLAALTQARLWGTQCLRSRSAVAEGFGHFDEVAGLEEAGDHVGADGCGAVVDVAEFAVEGWEFGAEVHDGDVHVVGAHLSGELFGGGDEATAEAGLLKVGIDGEQAEIAAVATQFDIDDSGKGAVFVGEEEAAFFEIRTGIFGREAIAFDEEGFDFEGLVDEGHQVGEVGFGGESDFHKGGSRQ